ncbi:MAG: YbaN family protein [Aquabacterium sp.]
MPTKPPAAVAIATPGAAVRLAWRVLGMSSVAIGIINAFIPLLPTTVFLLIGIWAYGKGDPAMRQRLLAHPRYGAALTLWIEHRQLSRRGKVAACTGITVSALLTLAMIGVHKPAGWVIAAGLATLCAYLLTRPEPSARL